MTALISWIPALKAPGFSPIPQRSITINATRDGEQNSGYKEVAVWGDLYSRAPLYTIPLHDGISATKTFAASAIDGMRALMLYDFDPQQPYAAVRTPNIREDITLTIDLNDGTGGGGAGSPATTQAAVRVDGLPAVRELAAIEKTTTGEWRFAGTQALQSGELELTVTGGELYVLGIDDRGFMFQPSITVTEGQRIRPSVYAGWVYQVTQSGQLPATEPAWWAADGENPPRLVGTARVQAVRYYQPQAHGPVPYTLK